MTKRKRLRGFTLESRLWLRVSVNGPTPAHMPHLGPCWVWTAPPNRKGYGSFKYHDQTVLAHRVSWVVHYGPIPDDTPFVLHRCDNRRCVNPKHLFLGTHLDNNRDRDAKGRQVARKGDLNGARLHPERLPRGERHRNAIASESTVREIRRRVANGERRCVIAADVGLHPSTVGAIACGRLWAHVEGAAPSPFRHKKNRT